MPIISVTTLFRPIGPKELQLIADLDYRKFPPCLPEQPIFYTICNEEYAIEIAKDWNAKNDGAGYVTQFAIKTAFLNDYERQLVGAEHHVEYWTPADKLEDFNNSLIGKIKVIHTYERSNENTSAN